MSFNGIITSWLIRGSSGTTRAIPFSSTKRPTILSLARSSTSAILPSRRPCWSVPRNRGQHPVAVQHLAHFARGNIQVGTAIIRDQKAESIAMGTDAALDQVHPRRQTKGLRRVWTNWPSRTMACRRRRRISRLSSDSTLSACDNFLALHRLSVFFQHRNDVDAFGRSGVYFPAFGPVFSTGFRFCHVIFLIVFVLSHCTPNIADGSGEMPGMSLFFNLARCLRSAAHQQLRHGILLTVQGEIGIVRTGLEVPPLLPDHRAVDPPFHSPLPRWRNW